MGQYWQRPTEDMSCRAAAWGAQWSHWADAETRSFGHNNLTAAPSERRLWKSWAFVCYARTVFLLGAGLPKKTRAVAHQMCTSVHVSLSAGKHAHLTIMGECFMMLRRNKNLKRKGSSDFMSGIIIFQNIHSVCPRCVTCSFMQAENGLVSLVTSVLAAPKITHWRAKQTHYSDVSKNKRCPGGLVSLM